ncbi:MAG TPA: serine/threonine protein kinase, partial [Minicystis sp.]|nr:serine/threonine protein kinase [Minicystis sp.]
MDGHQVPPASAPAAMIGKYRLIAELGHGGMAEVFLAVVRGPAGFNKLVVVKQIRPQLAEDPEFLGMFLDEARLAARLSHPN